MHAQKTNGAYADPIPDEERTMPPTRREDDRLEDVLRALERIAEDSNKRAAKDELADAQSREILHRLANSLESKKNGNGSQWIQYGISLALVIAGWVYSGVYVAKTTETEIRVANAVINERLETVRKEFDDYKRFAETERKVQGEKLNQVSIALEAKGIRMPYK